MWDKKAVGANSPARFSNPEITRRKDALSAFFHLRRSDIQTMITSWSGIRGPSLGGSSPPVCLVSRVANQIRPVFVFSKAMRVTISITKRLTMKSEQTCMPDSGQLIPFPVSKASATGNGHQLNGRQFQNPYTVQRIIDQMAEIDKICPAALNNVGNYVSTALETMRQLSK